MKANDKMIGIIIFFSDVYQLDVYQLDDGCKDGR